MKKTALTFGLLSGILIIAYSLAVFLLFGDFSKMSTADLAKVEMMGYLRYIILFLTIVFALRHFKKQSDAPAHFKQLFLAGLYTVLVIALLVGLMEAIYIWANPQFFEQYGALSAARLKESGASAAELAKFSQEMQDYRWMTNPAAMGLFYFVETAAIGAVLSAVVALVLRNRGKAGQVAAA